SSNCKLICITVEPETSEEFPVNSEARIKNPICSISSEGKVNRLVVSRSSSDDPPSGGECDSVNYVCLSEEICCSYTSCTEASIEVSDLIIADEREILGGRCF